MSKRNENLDDQIAALEAEIEVLQQRWKPYSRVQPGIPGAQTGQGPYNPALFLAKSELALQLDRKQVELAQLKRQQAQETLAAHEASGDLARAETAYQEATTAYEDAKQAYDAAHAELCNTRRNHASQRERHDAITRTVARYEADERRWAAELERDELLEANVRQGAAGPGIPAGPIGSWRTVLPAKGP